MTEPVAPGLEVGIGNDRSDGYGRDARFVVGMIALSLFRNGFGPAPHLKIFAVRSVDALPGVVRLHPHEQWQLWSPIGPIVPRLLDVHSVGG